MQALMVKLQLKKVPTHTPHQMALNTLSAMLPMRMDIVQLVNIYQNSQLLSSMRIQEITINLVHTSDPTKVHTALVHQAHITKEAKDRTAN